MSWSVSLLNISNAEHHLYLVFFFCNCCQAPVSMKSCIMAGWLMTVSVGNAIVVVFAEARLTDNMVRASALRDN